MSKQHLAAAAFRKETTELNNYSYWAWTGRVTKGDIITDMPLGTGGGYMGFSFKSGGGRESYKAVLISELLGPADGPHLQPREQDYGRFHEYSS